MSELGMIQAFICSGGDGLGKKGKRKRSYSKRIRGDRK